MTYTPVIELKNVTFKYKNCDKFALENVNFQVAQGDFVLLVGYSGSGKSTLLKTLNGLIPHFYSGLFGGDVKLFGESIAEKKTAQLAKTIGFVFQNPENQLSALTVEREIAFPLENFAIPRQEIRRRVNEIIALLDLEKIQDKSPFAISGGEQQLTAIGSALALDPPILVFDEITSHLSPQSATKIIKKIAELNREQGKTVILSEHRLDRNLQYVTKIAYIESGQLKAFGPPREVLHNKNYPLELYPRITSLYEQLKKVTDNFAILPEKHRKQLLAVPEPLTIDDFLLFIKGGRESV
ncbi:ABC transporter ATP-binding protein [Candidatus Heimdallarchaeota archaeon]|nr:MAG: ABC transporter ATP-binding protein [Candidatus Gerdarchaeota archaeon]RLI73656.1 MAG: ABC transporter ATP-binding protein [Candidatus Heimdallarchaeota archaeon]